MSQELGPMDIQRIMKRIPHRYPFLLVDRVVRLEKGSHIEAIKNVSINEPFFQGHFPGLPVMPGVLIVEALAQAGGVLVSETYDLNMDHHVFLFSGLDKVRFRKPVVPGDQLVLKLWDLKRKFQLFKMEGAAMVNGENVVEATLTAAQAAKENFL